MRKDPKEFRERFKRWKAGEKVYDAGLTLPEPVITPDTLYNEFINTLPDNQRLTPNYKYDTHRYWELNNKPKNFDEAILKGMYLLKSDGWHAGSVQWKENGDAEFMKPKTHSTVAYETGWYDRLPENNEFKQNYELIDDPDRPNFYMYKKRILPAYDGGTDSELDITNDSARSWMNNWYSNRLPILGSNAYNAWSDNPNIAPTESQKILYGLEMLNFLNIPKYDTGTDDYKTYDAQPLKAEPVVIVDAPSVYWDGFNWIGFDNNGVRQTKNANFNPVGAHIIKDPQQFEKLRLAQAKKTDVNHTHEFAELIRNFTTSLVMNGAGGAFAPSATPLKIGGKILDGVGAAENIASATGGIVGGNFGESLGYYTGRGLADFTNNKEKTELFALTGELVGGLLGGFIGSTYPIKAFSPDYKTISNITNNRLMRKLGINPKVSNSDWIDNLALYDAKMRATNWRLADITEHITPNATLRATFNLLYSKQLSGQPISIDEAGLLEEMRSLVQDKSVENLNRLSRLVRNNPEYTYYLNELGDDMQGLPGFNYIDEYAYRPDIVRDFLKRQGRTIRGTHHPNLDAQTAKTSLTVAPKTGTGGDRLNTRGLYTSNTPTIAERFKNPLSEMEPETGYVGRLFHDLGIPEDLPIEQQLYLYRLKIYSEPDWVRATGIDRPEGIHAVENRYMFSSGERIGDDLAGYERSYLPENTNTIERLDVYPESVDRHGRWGYGVNPEYDSELFIPRMFNSTTDYISLAKRFLRGTEKHYKDYNLLNKLDSQTEHRAYLFRDLYNKNHAAYRKYNNVLKNIKLGFGMGGAFASLGLLPAAANGSNSSWYYDPEKNVYYDLSKYVPNTDFNKLRPIKPKKH